MNDTEIRELAESVAGLLRARAELSEPLRRAVGLIGKWLCEIAEGTSAGRGVAGAQEQAAGASGTPAAPVPEVVVRARAADTARGLPVASAVVPLKIGDAVVHVPTTGTTAELGRARAAAAEFDHGGDGRAGAHAGTSEIDLGLIEERCRLKAASCRLFIERRGAAAGSERERDALARMNAMLARGKALPGCFLWVFWRQETPPDDATLARIADCYDALAEGAALVRRIDEAEKGRRTEEEASAMRLLAEADSALRVALEETWLTEDDRDQSEAHLWLRRETAWRRVYVERFMSLDDPADPEGAGGLRERIAGAGGRLEARLAAAKGVRAELGRIRYHAGQVVKNRGEDSAGDWSRIADAVRRLEGLGVLASDARIAEAVGPGAGALWAEGSEGGEVLRGVAARAAALAGVEGEAEDPAAAEPREWSARVLAVRDLLRGKRMVIIGGEPNEQAAERLTRAFELEEAEWVELAEHGPGGPMRAPIGRPDTAVVVVIVKLTGHLHADEARAHAAAAGKPCVLLSGGYNPERVAVEVLEQASERLGV